MATRDIIIIRQLIDDISTLINQSNGENKNSIHELTTLCNNISEEQKSNIITILNKIDTNISNTDTINSKLQEISNSLKNNTGSSIKNIQHGLFKTRISSDTPREDMGGGYYLRYMDLNIQPVSNISKCNIQINTFADTGLAPGIPVKLLNTNTMRFYMYRSDMVYIIQWQIIEYN